MTELHLPWLELVVLMPLVGALWVARYRDPDIARKACLLFTGVIFALSVGAWLDFQLLGSHDSDDRFHLPQMLFGWEPVVIDKLSAPLLPMTSLLYLLATLATARTKARRFSFTLTLISESIILATYCCKDPSCVALLLGLGTLPPLYEMRLRKHPTTAYSLHMGLFILLLAAGALMLRSEGTTHAHSLVTCLLLLGAVLIRSGIAPFHCWLTDMFERASLGSSLLFVLPLPGAYGAARLVLPVAPDWVLHAMGLLSLITAVYAAAMALVQREGRRFFCYVFLSHSALILVGLEMLNPIGLTGALCMWISVGTALGGLGLTLRALEARRGRITLTEYHGLYDLMPNLAMFFLLTGFASVGFPGTIGFVGSEMLVDGAIEAYPYVGPFVVVAAAMNGIAVVSAYFTIFTGRKSTANISLRISARERFAVLSLAALLLLGGMVPQLFVAPRFRAAEELLEHRRSTLSAHTSAAPHAISSRE